MIMRKENSVKAGYGVPSGRITRAQAAACKANGGVLSSKPPIAKPNKKVQMEKAKRKPLGESCQVDPTNASSQRKKRAVLIDITNICKKSYGVCVNAAKMQPKVSQCVEIGSSKSTLCSVGSALTHPDTKYKMTEGIGIEMLESQGTMASVGMKENVIGSQTIENARDGERTCITNLLEEVMDHPKSDQASLFGLDFVDIDSDKANPQMCSLYACDIYSNLRARELARRPSSSFMETMQRDITQSMRGILIDWLVEVSEEYKLVPDTLYLTVYIIDVFLSKNYVERQRLQLVGITSMLIASKYEEICAPRVEEFCFITDNTYTKREVLKMESEILKYLQFQLSVPTIKTFLRRFLRVAQASLKVPSVALGCLSNYLAELTLVEYSFVKFLPSVIAASSVFLALWMLDQSVHPWNRTLEHYTSYKASELKASVLAIKELQMNSKSCSLNAIREKYKQQKFESVAALTCPTMNLSFFY